MDIPVDAMKALKTLEARLKDPHPVVQMVSVKAQVEAVKMVVAKEIAPLVSRLDTIEIKTLIPIERGERGRDGKDGRVDYKVVNDFLNKALSEKYALETEDLSNLMEITWDKW